MDVTFENTVKNATSFPPIPLLREDSKGKKTSSKKVSFQEEEENKEKWCRIMILQRFFFLFS